jgi:hypothetical protein
MLTLKFQFFHQKNNGVGVQSVFGELFVAQLQTGCVIRAYVINCEYGK